MKRIAISLLLLTLAVSARAQGSVRQVLIEIEQNSPGLKAAAAESDGDTLDQASKQRRSAEIGPDYPVRLLICICQPPARLLLADVIVHEGKRYWHRIALLDLHP